MRKDKKGSERAAVPPKRGEAALEGTDKLLQTLLDHTHMLVAYLDPKFNFVRVNRAYARADERDPSFFPGKNHFDLYPSAENEGIFKEVVKTGKPYLAYAKPFEYAEHPERGVSYWDWSLIPTKVPSGAVARLVLTLVNVTERKLTEEALKKAHDELEIRVGERTRELSAANIKLKEEVAERQRAEEKLRASEEKYKTLVQTSRDMIFTVDLQGNFLFTNQAFGKILGYSAEEIGSLNGFDLVHPEDSKTVAQQFARLVEGESVDNMEYRYRRKEGSYITILNNAAPVFDTDGNVAAALGVARDITQRKQAEKALQESELWMRNMFNSLEEAVLVITPDRALVNINEAAKRMFGYEKDELVDLSTEVLHVDHEHYVEFGRRIQEAFDKGIAASFEFEAKRKDGEIFPTDHTVTLLKNNIGESLGIVSVVRDVTERKRAERELNQYREHLEELVEERTAKLERTNQQLAREVTERRREEQARERALQEAHRRQAEITALLEASGAVLRHREFPEAAKTIFDSCKSLIGATAGYVALLSTDGTENELLFLDSGILRCTVDPSLPMPIRGLREQAYRTGQTVYHNDFFESEWVKYMPPGHATLDNVLFAPLTIEGKAAGLLGLANKPGGFSQDDARIASAFGELAAVALRNSRTLEELEHSEERFRSVAQTANDAVITVGRTGNIVFWNRAAEITFGHSADQVVGKPLTLIMPERFHQSHEEGMRHVLSTGETKIIGETVEMTGLRRDGGEFPVELSIATWKSGEEVFFTGILRDITERKHAEQALRESEEKFRGLAEQSPNMIFINRKGRVVYANRRCEEIMGYKRKEFYSPDFDFLEMVAPESRDLVRENFSKHRRGQQVRPYEYTLCTKDGKYTEAILNSRLITYAGEPAILGIVTDITERKRVEEELRKRTYDLGERVKELNCLYLISNLVEKPGISLEEILQGTANLIPAAWEYPEIACARVILGDNIFRTDNFEETAWNQLTDITVHGNPVGSVEVCYLEERPEKYEGPFLAEERNLLKAIAERLGRVVERTQAREEIQKLNESLSAQAKELSAANKELEAFSYSASHDLRAPLRTIDGFSRALLEDYPDKLDETGKDYLRRVRSATQRMGELIDDLLNLSLTMRTEMRREETNLSRLATSIAAELQRIQPERGVEFVVQDEVLAHGDARLLRELLENLLGNAWKFTGKNARPRIEFGITEKEGEEVYFVRDNGVGFDMTYADKLFVPFQRLHSDSEFSGNGIGLALVSRIVNRHGGRIWAEGEVEKGATFYFTLE